MTNCQTKSCRWQAEHLQLLNKVTNFTVSCCCVENHLCRVQHEIRSWLIVVWWKKTTVNRYINGSSGVFLTTFISRSDTRSYGLNDMTWTQHDCWHNQRCYSETNVAGIYLWLLRSDQTALIHVWPLLMIKVCTIALVLRDEPLIQWDNRLSWRGATSTMNAKCIKYWLCVCVGDGEHILKGGSPLVWHHMQSIK